MFTYSSGMPRRSGEGRKDGRRDRRYEWRIFSKVERTPASVRVRPSVRGHCSPASLNLWSAAHPAERAIISHFLEISHRWRFRRSLHRVDKKMGRAAAAEMTSASTRSNRRVPYAVPLPPFPPSHTVTFVPPYCSAPLSLPPAVEAGPPHPSIHGGTFRWTRTSGG